MNREEWERVRSVLERVLDAEPDARDDVLAELCGRDDALRARIEAYLRAERGAGPLLEGPVGEYAPRLLSRLSKVGGGEAASPGERIGPYRVVREIARGGMGTVYLAERADGQFEQRVAVKLLRRGLDTEEVLERFLAERQILASLDHPDIARLLDGGATPDGRPYLVMEHVEGEEIDRYCDHRRLSVEERLRLFLRVAGAVRHAHRRLVVHRDLKPANILVSAAGRVKLLDFGIAKLLRGDRADTGPLTLPGARLLTPEYASPEQVLGEPITTASDVYQLGLLLHELLTGRRAHRIAGRTQSAIERTVCETDPPPMSAVVTEEPGDDTPGGRREPTTSEVADARRTTPDRLRRRLRGDLDAIALKALRRGPEERYPSVEALMEDVHTHLDGGAVRARGPGRAYRARRFLLRHRWGVGAAAALLALFAGYAVTVGIQAERVRAALHVAQTEVATSEQVTEFLLGLFEASRPEQARGEEVTARTLLERGVERADALADQPEVQARMLAVVGRTYHRLGLFDEAQPLYERALAVRERHAGGDDPETALVLSDLAVLHRDRGEMAAAEPLQRKAVEMRRRLLGDSHPDLAVSLDELGRILQDLGDYAAAEPLFREGLEIRRRALGGDHNEVASSLNSVGLVLRNLGRHDEAEPLFREALRINRARFGDRHPWSAPVLSNLALVHIEREEWGAAEALLMEALDTDRAIHGEDHSSVAIRLHHLGTVRRGQGRYAAADSAGTEAVRIARAALGDSHIWVATFLGAHARTSLARGAADRSEVLLREALDIFGQSIAPDDWRIAEAESVLGEALAAQGRFEEAEPLLRDSHAALERRWGPDDRRTRDAAARLAVLREAAVGASDSPRRAD